MKIAFWLTSLGQVAALGWLKPVTAALLMTVSSIKVILMARWRVNIAFWLTSLGQVAGLGWLKPVTAGLLMTVSSSMVILMALNVLNIEVAGEDRVLVD